MMKTEYLITFDSNDDVCTNVDKFKNLLSVHSSLSFPKKEKIIFKGNEFSYQLAQGRLTDDSLYYDLTIENPDTKNLDNYVDMLREIRKICAKISSRNIIILHDGIGQYYCQEGYPIIYKTENLMRKLISKFMAISIGYDWREISTPKEVLDSVRSEVKKEKTNFLQEVDFIQLSTFLFKKYTKADSTRFIDSLKEKKDDEVIRVGELKQYSPFTNWEKYFSKRVNCDSTYLESKWERLYDYRCKIAHCKGLNKVEFEDLEIISKDICEKIQTALDSIEDLHVEDIEREELAENFIGTANKFAAEFITKYNKLVLLLRSVCELSSNENDAYFKHPTNKTNIMMQSHYIWSVKGLINKGTMLQINQFQAFRNKIVHQVGIAEVNEADLIEKIAAIESIYSEIGGLSPERQESLKGVDLKNEQPQGKQNLPKNLENNDPI